MWILSLSVFPLSVASESCQSVLSLLSFSDSALFLSVHRKMVFGETDPFLMGCILVFFCFVCFDGSTTDGVPQAYEPLA